MTQQYTITLSKRNLTPEKIDLIELYGMYSMVAEPADQWSIKDDGFTLMLTSETYRFRMYDFLEEINVLSSILGKEFY